MQSFVKDVDFFTFLVLSSVYLEELNFFIWKIYIISLFGNDGLNNQHFCCHVLILWQNVISSTHLKMIKILMTLQGHRQGKCRSIKCDAEMRSNLENTTRGLCRTYLLLTPYIMYANFLHQQTPLEFP